MVDLYVYIAAEASPEIGARFTDGIVTYCESLSTFPDRGTRRTRAAELSVSSIRYDQEIRDHAVVFPIECKIDLVSQLTTVCKLLSNPGNQELFCSLQFPRIRIVPPIY